MNPSAERGKEDEMSDEQAVKAVYPDAYAAFNSHLKAGDEYCHCIRATVRDHRFSPLTCYLPTPADAWADARSRLPQPPADVAGSDALTEWPKDDGKFADQLKAGVAALTESAGEPRAADYIPWDMPTDDRRTYDLIAVRPPGARTPMENIFKKYADLLFQSIQAADALRKRAVLAEIALQELEATPSPAREDREAGGPSDKTLSVERAADWLLARGIAWGQPTRQELAEWLHDYSLTTVPAAPVSPVGESEMEVRRLMWIHHGHSGIYGDDGEMQCGECRAFGCWDYKNAPIEAVRKAYQLALLSRNFAAPLLSPKEEPKA